MSEFQEGGGERSGLCRENINWIVQYRVHQLRHTLPVYNIHLFFLRVT